MQSIDSTPKSSEAGKAEGELRLVVEPLGHYLARRLVPAARRWERPPANWQPAPGEVYYDLLELADGTHVPVPLVDWRWASKLREAALAGRLLLKMRQFSCPVCGEQSFFSQLVNGCENCGAFDPDIDYEQPENEQEEFERQILAAHWQKKRRWERRRYRVVAYISAATIGEIAGETAGETAGDEEVIE